MNEVNKKLEKEFAHDNINCAHHRGSEEGDNYFQINFYNYDMSSKSYSELEELGKKVKWFFNKQNTGFKNLEYIEVMQYHLLVSNKLSWAKSVTST